MLSRRSSRSSMTKRQQWVKGLVHKHMKMQSLRSSTTQIQLPLASNFCTKHHCLLGAVAVAVRQRSKDKDHPSAPHHTSANNPMTATVTISLLLIHCNKLGQLLMPIKTTNLCHRHCHCRIG